MVARKKVAFFMLSKNKLHFVYQKPHCLINADSHGRSRLPCQVQEPVCLQRCETHEWNLKYGIYF